VARGRRRRLHVDVVAAEQHEIGRERRSLVHDRVEAGDIVRMRSGVKIGEKGDAQRAPPVRPAVDLQTKPANNVPLRAADLCEPSLAAKLVTKRRSQDGAGQSASRAMRSYFAHGSSFQANARSD
jgi:hypothetical protein